MRSGPRFPADIRTRVALALAGQTLLVALLVTLVLFLGLRGFLRLAQQESLELLLPRVTVALPEARNGVLRRPAPNVDVRVLQGGQVLAATPNFPGLPRDLPDSFRARQGHEVLVRSVTLGGRRLTVQIAADQLGAASPLSAFLRALLLALAAAVLLAALLSLLTAGRLVRPIRKLQRAAAAVQLGGDLRAALPGTTRRDELGQLAQTLQETFAHLADAREREQEFTRAAAHDLRSPLAALSVRLDGLLGVPRSPAEYREELHELRFDVTRMTQLAEKLLLLARNDSALQLTTLDLADMVGDCVDRARERFPSARIDFEGQGDTRVFGDAGLLTHAVENLLDNGVRHGGSRLVLACVRGGSGHVRLSVRDDGPGVPPPTLVRLGEAFYRVDPTRGGEGNGLGLAIVRRVAELHGAQLTFLNRQPGFEVQLDFAALAARPAAG